MSTSKSAKAPPTPRPKPKPKRKGGQRAGVSVAAVVDTAILLFDRDADVSLVAVAAALRIKTPSLYTHVRSLEHLRRLMKARTLEMLVAVTTAAAVGRAERDALFAVCDAQRAFAKEHPGLLPLTVNIDAADDDRAHAAAAALLACISAILRGYGLTGDDALHATRLLRAATSGFFALEAAGGFGMPLQVDESWRRLKELLHAGLSSQAAATQH
jgi:AcrR family transcriptional regulator